MAVYEHIGIQRWIDKNGDTHICYPATKIDALEDGDEIVKSTPQELSESEKVQIRTNIGAGTATEEQLQDVEDKIPTDTVTSAQLQAVENKIPTDASDVGARPDSWMPTASQVGADPSGTASSMVSSHNTNDSAHSDIRLLITNLANRLNTIANSTDTDLDQLAELVTYIKANRELIESITTSKVGVDDIIDNLTTNVSNKPLSAKQGVALKALYDSLPAWSKAAAKPTYTASEVGARPNTWMPSASDVGADPAGTASSAVSGHNTNTSAHNDIRELITNLTNRLNALANSDDTTLDQMAEVVAYIKSNRSLIEEVTTNKVNVTDIIDNLTTNVSNKPLSAAQGVALKSLIDALQTVATQTEAGLMSADDKKKLDGVTNKGIRTSGSGSAYTATVPSITEFAVGISFVMIPHTDSTTTEPTLSVNGWPAMPICRRASGNNNYTSSDGDSVNWLVSGKPVLMILDSEYWYPDIYKPKAGDLDGQVYVRNGGTGRSSLTAGSYLVGDGTNKVALKTPAQVLSNIGAQAKITGTDGQFVTIGSDGKPVAKTVNSENWTFTLEDGSTVTKAVYVG